jgi:isoleucyl-tRNA synthetase
MQSFLHDILIMTSKTDASQQKTANLKETLNLPQTAFSMRANAANREPAFQQQWEANNIYEAALTRRNRNKPFVLHDGPPYLSSPNIHIGHALNKILKDIVTRYNYQRGYWTPYVPGYDGHGLPIENAVVKKIKGGRNAVSAVELREQCRQFGLDNLKGQEANFKRLGVWGNWDEPYVTTDKAAVAEQLRLFGGMQQKGYIYKGLKPVYWSPVSETALADAEVEYADHTSHSIYVSFTLDATGMAKANQLSDELKPLLDGAKFIIWTTTPWTLPANLALSVHPGFEYAIVRNERFGKLVIAKDLLTAFEEAANCGCLEPIATFKGKELELCEASHPFLDRKSVVLLGTHVTLDAGTGIVHTAPGHGMEDYVVCQNYDHDLLKERPLGILSPVNNKGVYTADVGHPQLEGLFYEKANEVILEILRDKSALLGHSTFVHSYPHDWRTHTPVIYRATDQWFVNIDACRQTALEAIKTATWIPTRGEARIATMVENRTDWCISRQRVWGVPIPAFYDAETKELIEHEALIPHIADLVAEHGSDVWWAWDESQLLAGLPDSVKTELGLPQRKLIKDTDIMDVWFDSGVTHTTVVKARQDELGNLPAQLYLEGSDQHRGWFQSSLLTSVMLTGKAPYEQVLTHGFVLDGNGRKMSKSQGNVIDPLKIINQYGADVLRLWVASVDYSVDVRIGDTIVKQLVEVYKKIRNTVRYLLGNLADFSPATDMVAESELDLLDRYTLHRLGEVTATLTDAFDQYQFHKYYQVLQNFCVVECSQLYFDVAKDILYTYPVDHPERRAMQTVLYKLLQTLTPMLVPVLPHLAEDVWQNIPAHQRWSEVASGVLLDWPNADIFTYQNSANEFLPYLAVREKANEVMEPLRKDGVIGGALEASLTITHHDQLDAAFITKLCLVSHIELTQGDELTVMAEKANGDKCPRCWKVINGDHPPAYHPCEQYI